MKKIFIILTLCLLSQAFRHRYRHRRSLFKNRVHKLQKIGSLDPSVILINEAQKQEMEEKNKKAEQLFADPATRKGRDEPEEATYKHLWVKTMTSDMFSPLANDRPRMKDVMLNSHTLSILDIEKSYRGIEEGISLEDLVHPGDDPAKGNCCSGISDPSIENFPIQTESGFTSKTLNCIELRTASSTLKLCSINPMEIAEFRVKIITQVIKAHMRKLGVYNVNVIMPTEAKPDFTWHEPETWDSLCKEGKRQSPINLSQSTAQNQAHMSLLFVFKESPRATVSFDGNEMEVHGDFGTIIHKLEVGQRKYSIDKLRFKFPSEHLIDNAVADMELQLFMSGINADNAVASFLIVGDASGEWNEFLDKLQYEHWRAERGFSMDLSKKPSLNYLETIKGSNGEIKYTTNDVFRRSFFWYGGSYTTSPCTEGIQRIILSEPISVPRSQLNHMKEKVFNSQIHIRGNSKPVKSLNGRPVYYHQDNGKKCATKEEENFDWLWEDKKEEHHTKHSIDLSRFKPSYIRASSTTTTYGYTHGDLPSNMNEIEQLGHDGSRQSISLSEVKSHEVPYDVQSRLRRKFYTTSNDIRRRRFEGDLDSAIIARR